MDYELHNLIEYAALKAAEPEVANDLYRLHAEVARFGGISTPPAVRAGDRIKRSGSGEIPAGVPVHETRWKIRRVREPEGFFWLVFLYERKKDVYVSTGAGYTDWRSAMNAIIGVDRQYMNAIIGADRYYRETMLASALSARPAY